MHTLPHSSPWPQHRRAQRLAALVAFAVGAIAIGACSSSHEVRSGSLDASTTVPPTTTSPAPDGDAGAAPISVTVAADLPGVGPVSITLGASAPSAPDAPLEAEANSGATTLAMARDQAGHLVGLGLVPADPDLPPIGAADAVVKVDYRTTAFALALLATHVTDPLIVALLAGLTAGAPELDAAAAALEAAAVDPAYLEHPPTEVADAIDALVRVMTGEPPAPSAASGFISPSRADSCGQTSALRVASGPNTSVCITTAEEESYGSWKVTGTNSDPRWFIAFDMSTTDAMPVGLIPPKQYALPMVLTLIEDMAVDIGAAWITEQKRGLATFVNFVSPFEDVHWGEDDPEFIDRIAARLHSYVDDAQFDLYVTFPPGTSPILGIFSLMGPGVADVGPVPALAHLAPLMTLAQGFLLPVFELVLGIPATYFDVAHGNDPIWTEMLANAAAAIAPYTDDVVQLFADEGHVSTLDWAKQAFGVLKNVFTNAKSPDSLSRGAGMLHILELMGLRVDRDLLAEALGSAAEQLAFGAGIVKLADASTTAANLLLGITDLLAGLDDHGDNDRFVLNGDRRNADPITIPPPTTTPPSANELALDRFLNSPYPFGDGEVPLVDGAGSALIPGWGQVALSTSVFDALDVAGRAGDFVVAVSAGELAGSGDTFLWHISGGAAVGPVLVNLAADGEATIADHRLVWRCASGCGTDTVTVSASVVDGQLRQDPVTLSLPADATAEVAQEATDAASVLNAAGDETWAAIDAAASAVPHEALLVTVEGGTATITAIDTACTSTVVGSVAAGTWSAGGAPAVPAGAVGVLQGSADFYPWVLWALSDTDRAWLLPAVCS